MKYLNLKRFASTALLSAAALPALAAGPTIDTTPVTENIGSGLIALAAIGGAVLGFMALRKVWRLVNSSV